MGFLSFFKLNLFDPDAFDKELTALTQAISRTRNQVTALSVKRKAVSRNITYPLAIAYVAWIAYRYRVSLNNLGPLALGKSHFAIFLSGQDTQDLLYTVLFPLVIATLVFLLDTLFDLWISSKNKSLQGLLKRHKSKIEDLKRVTNFNTTSLLLQKYSKEGDPQLSSDNGGKKKAKGQNQANASQKPGVNSGTSTGSSLGQSDQRPKKLPATINRPNIQVNGSNPQGNGANYPVGGPHGQSDTRRTDASVRRSSPVQGPVHKSLQDRLLDYIIGSEHNESVESRYALICSNCYTHNGLAPPGCTDPHTVTYICRQCGYINGALDTPPSSGTLGSGVGSAVSSMPLSNQASPTFIVTSPSLDSAEKSSTLDPVDVNAVEAEIVDESKGETKESKNDAIDVLEDISKAEKPE